MKQLLISDLHLTANPRDEYRWALFPWLRKTIAEHNVMDLFILGDLTEAKDYHSAKLVNRIVDEIVKVSKDEVFGRGPVNIWILRGNHDGIDPECAYFRFLDNVPSVNYIDTPYMAPMNGSEVLFLPHTTEPAKAWDCVSMPVADVVLMHATVGGVLAENGQALEGIPPALLARAARAKIYSGDVHVPQKIGRVEYVGAPYPIRFGDSFRGRAVLLDGWKKPVDLFLPTIQRKTITIGPAGPTSQDLDGLHKGDQIKVRVRLTAAEYGDWQQAKAATLDACDEIGVEVCSLELERADAPKKLLIAPRRAVLVRKPDTIFDEFCEARDVDATLRSAGKDILKKAL